MPIERQLLYFVIPVSQNSLGKRTTEGRKIIPMYINPQQIRINESKIISSQLTKGGYSIQYWGEELTKLELNGTTGSGGIEAINILRDLVYRNEIKAFSEILNQRGSSVQEEFVSALESISGRSLSIKDRWNAIKENISFDPNTLGGGALEEFLTSNPTSVPLIPTIGAFATNMIIYWQGEMFQGFITSFNVSEEASTPGHFSYDMSFTVLKRAGKRKNFMAWHRNPLGPDGAPVTASIPREGPMPEELSIPIIPVRTIDEILQNGNVTSTFVTDQSAQKEKNSVDVNRNQSLRGR